jgi:hypothetical protein
VAGTEIVGHAMYVKDRSDDREPLRQRLQHHG